MPESKLGQKFQDILKGFIKELQNIYQTELVSVILYGSAASGEFVDGYSNLNALVILKNTNPDTLRKASDLSNKLRFRRINPLFLTKEFMQSSGDVFPIEFLDMKENYSLLWGEDVLKDIKVDLKNLRFQCEQELKAKLLNLKTQYLKLSKDKLAIKNLLFRSFTSVVHILRNVLRLKGITPPYQKIDVLRQIATEFQMRIEVFKRILEAKNHPIELTGKDAEDLFISFLRELEIIANIVDRI